MRYTQNEFLDDVPEGYEDFSNFIYNMQSRIYVKDLGDEHYSIIAGNTEYTLPKAVFDVDYYNEFAFDGEHIAIHGISLPAYIWNSITFRWIYGARRHHSGYEVSSKGNKDFSAFFARLRNGKTIEEAYQLDIKGYRELGYTVRDAKGKPPRIPRSFTETDFLYTELWWKYLGQNPKKEQFLRQVIHSGRYEALTDMFANTNISQAKSIAQCLCVNPIVTLGYDVDSAYKRGDII